MVLVEGLEIFGLFFARVGLFEMCPFRRISFLWPVCFEIVLAWWMSWLNIPLWIYSQAKVEIGCSQHFDCVHLLEPCKLRKSFWQVCLGEYTVSKSIRAVYL